MEAPVYLPASAFEAPRRLPRLLTVRDTPIAVLKRIPAAWAMVEKEIPGVERRIGSEQLRPHLQNFSFESLVVFGVVTREALDRLDRALTALGEQP